MALEDRDWFREESRRHGGIIGTFSNTPPPRAPATSGWRRPVSANELGWTLVAVAIQACIFVADEVGLLDVPFI
jgi:hypothetical protein